MSAPRLLADDLTGALDAAAPFAAARGAIAVRWLPEDGTAAVAWPDGPAALSTSSRDLSEAEAVARVERLAGGLADAAPAFKKIDSLLRGNTGAEIVAAHRAGGFATTLVAPAFPAQGRRVRAGRLRIGDADGPDVAALLARAGAGPGVAVCDAESEADLAALVAAHRARRRLLWAGSSGLARALSGPARPCAVPGAAAVLFVTGSRHPVTQRHVAAVAAVRPDALIGDDGAVVPGEVGRSVAARLAGRRSTAFLAAADAARMAALFAPLAAAAPPGLLVVAGGDTLLRLLAALRCRSLTVRGEVAAGLPLATIEDGAWAGVTLISKSGAFEDGGLITRLLAPSVGACA